MNWNRVRQSDTVGLLIWILLLLSAIPAPHRCLGAGLSPANLRCEHRFNPTGLDVAIPRLSWSLESSERGQRQTAFEILVASSPGALTRGHGDLWSSGRINSDATLNVEYLGRPLRSRETVFWKVRVWDSQRRPSPWSSPASWTMGLLNLSEWKARWIGDALSSKTLLSSNAPGALPGALLRKPFSLDAPVRRAIAYVSALGLYELSVNGQVVGNQILPPEWTSYRRRVQYQTYDVTSLLRSGSNVVAAFLGEGWFSGRLMAVGRFAYGNAPRFLLQLEIELVDGRSMQVNTDGSWHSTLEGPIRSSGIYDGETYDAHFEQPGWDQAGYVEDPWTSVQDFGLENEPRLVWQRNEPIQIVQELTPIALGQVQPGVFVFDFGQNMVGRCRLRAQGKAGQTITLRHAEMLNDDGTVYVANLRGAPQVDRYIPRADGAFEFEPRFTYHGFRFVEVTGLAAAPETNALLGRVFHSAAPQVGLLECSEPALNQLARNILWTERANLMSSPNDCPQRDERFGWMGDIQAFAQTASFNLNLAAFFAKFSQDIRDDQATDGRFPDFAPHPGNPDFQFSGAPAWADAGVLVPWCAWVNYADQRLLTEHFESARRWIEYVLTRNPSLIWETNRSNDYNDWLNGDWIRQDGWPKEGGSTPKEVFATAFFAHSTEVVARMASQLGRTAEAQRYGALFERIRSAFNQRFVHPDGSLEGGTQGGYALALDFDLLPVELRPTAARLLADNIHHYHDHLSTGIQTTHRAMLQLARWGDTDLAWQLLTNRTFPSWRYMIDNGATTIWERWDGYVKGRGFQDAGMNSFNHWAFGAVGEWMWRYIGGLSPDEQKPGWKHFIVSPRPGGGVTWGRAEYESIRGRILSSWRIQEGMFHLNVSIPANTTATVILPTSLMEKVRESGHPLNKVPQITALRAEGKQVWLEVESGDYHFTAEAR